jgi:hypothetical protein
MLNDIDRFKETYGQIESSFERATITVPVAKDSGNLSDGEHICSEEQE